MAWNPSPEVAAVRDAAKALGDAPIAVVIFITPNGDRLGMASYGKTKKLCDEAGKLGSYLFKKAMEWENHEEQP